MIVEFEVKNIHNVIRGLILNQNITNFYQKKIFIKSKLSIINQKNLLKIKKKQKFLKLFQN